jgi:hypothetical protein
MSYRKLKADYLFDGFKLHSSDTVLICRPDGTFEDLVTAEQAGGALNNIQAFFHRALSIVITISNSAI